MSKYGPREYVENLKRGDILSDGRKVMEVEIHNTGPLKNKRIIYTDGKLKGRLVHRNQIIELNKE